MSRDYERVTSFWGAQIGQLPGNVGRSKLSTWANRFGAIPVIRAIDKASFIELYEDSDDVILGVEVQLKAWLRRGLISDINNQGEQTNVE